MSDPADNETPQTPMFSAEQQLAALAEVFGAEYVRDFQDPVLFMPAVFRSPTVKQFYKREFPLISRTLIVESVYRRRPTYNQNVLDDFAAMSSRKLADILTLLGTQCERLRMICKTNGVQVDATYMHPDERLVPIIAGHAKTYLAVLRKLDELYQLAGSANLNGVIDSSVRMKTELLSRKAVRAFSAMLRNEIFKLYKESQRMRAAQNGQPADKELDRAESAHSEAVGAFDSQNASGDALDTGDQVDPAMASQVIDDLTAGVKAVRPKKKAAEKASEDTPVVDPSEVTS